MTRKTTLRDLDLARDRYRSLIAKRRTEKATLILQLQKLIAARGLRQAQVAKILGVTQPRVSDLLRGRIDLFSTDTIIDMLARLGVRVKIVLEPSRRGLKAANRRVSRASFLPAASCC